MTTQKVECKQCKLNVTEKYTELTFFKMINNYRFE